MLTVPQDTFLIFGHRGASAHARENTREAIEVAAAQGAHGVELDVRRTADGELVVHHDSVAAGLGPIIEHTAGELRRHDPELLGFAEAMGACGDLIVNIEIKNFDTDPDFDPDDTVAAEVVAWVHEHGWEDRVIISSFNHATVDHIRHLSGAIATGQLILPGADAAKQLLHAHLRGHQALNPHLTSLTDPAELSAVAAGLDMWLVAWTVDDPETIRGLRSSGFTGIITNDPAGATAAVST
ncbi:MAG: glycerophosphodiester phosphodiesterase [Acidimicrobiia bacterium]|nr:glycerophosphodiester phosphodiesterase [Acidimicrobiia bacterium]NNF88701.1 glycerophosphodiester phosphodiesterase [Acidimicrobiia bacterium]